jgi:Cu-Zn family superoxide dismutase
MGSEVATSAIADPLKGIRSMIRSSLLAGVAVLLAGCASVGGIADRHLGTAVLGDAKGLPAGTATLTAIPGDKVKLSIAAIGLAPGPHGLHVHTIGKCEAPGFASAGPHLNPAGHQHGTANPAGSHLGDLPNLIANSAGAAALSVELSGTARDLLTQLFDNDGAALVIHAAADDYRTDPTGNSGARMVCGVLLRQAS